MDQVRENVQDRGKESEVEVQSNYTGLPVEFKNYIREMIKDKPPTHIDDGILVLQKTLSNCDVNPQKGRIAFPSSSLILSPRLVESCLRPGIKVALIGPSLQQHTFVNVMKKRKKKNPGKDSALFELTTSWNEVVSSNNLEAGQIVQLWAVRFDERYCLALRRLTTEEGNNASGGSDAAAKPSPSSTSDS